jgi:restriction system protein
LLEGPKLLALVQSVQNHPDVAPTGQPSESPAAPTCPQCGKSMVLRTARRGSNAGNQFWGCSAYPACKGIRDF